MAVGAGRREARTRMEERRRGGWMQASKDNQEVRNNCGGGGYWACFHGNLPVEGEGDGDGIDGGLCVDVYECNMVDQMALTEIKKKITASFSSIFILKSINLALICFRQFHFQACFFWAKVSNNISLYLLSLNLISYEAISLVKTANTKTQTSSPRRTPALKYKNEWTVNPTVLHLLWVQEVWRCSWRWKLITTKKTNVLQLLVDILCAKNLSHDGINQST